MFNVIVKPEETNEGDDDDDDEDQEGYLQLDQNKDNPDG